MIYSNLMFDVLCYLPLEALHYFPAPHLIELSHFTPLSPRPVTHICAKGVCDFQFEELDCCLVINPQLLWFSNHESYCPPAAVIYWLNQYYSHKQADSNCLVFILVLLRKCWHSSNLYLMWVLIIILIIIISFKFNYIVLVFSLYF